MIGRSIALVTRSAPSLVPRAMLPFSTAAAGAGEAPKRTHPAPWRVPDPDGPKIVKLRSEKVFLNAGEKVWWCSCGLSKEQPWCDGSHEGTKFEPVEFTAPEAKLYSMCLCKYSQKGALCDGIHKQYIGWEPPVRPAGGAASGSNGSGPEAAAAATAAAADSK